MTTTAFQFIFDNAETISIDKRAITAQTISRDNTVRSISRGGQSWRFEVTLPDGMPWDTTRPYIEKIMAADRYTTGNIQINNSGYNSWLTNYQGNSVNYTGFSANVTKGNTTMTLTTSPTTSSGYKFKAGDIIQLGGTGNVYVVTSDVAYNSNSVTLNRPVKDNTGSFSLRVGPNVYWNVICVDLPKWTIFSRNQVRWSGPFVFYEDNI